MRPNRHPDSTSGLWPRLLLAALVSLALCLLAVTLSPGAPPASASPSGTGRDVLVEAWEEEGEEEWELEEQEEEGEEEDAWAEEAKRAGGTAGPIVLPPECVLQTALPSVVAGPDESRLRLSIRYTAETETTKVGVNYWLKGGKGTRQLGSATYPLHARGTLRMSRHLDVEDAPKVRAARIFVIQLKLRNVAGSCKRYLTFRLTKRHSHGNNTTWSE